MGSHYRNKDWIKKVTKITCLEFIGLGNEPIRKVKKYSMNSVSGAEGFR